MKYITDKKSFSELNHSVNNQKEHLITLTEDTTISYIDNDIIYSRFDINAESRRLIIDLDNNKLWKPQSISIYNAILSVNQCPVLLKVYTSRVNPNINCNEIIIEKSNIEPPDYDYKEDPSKMVQKLEISHCNIYSSVLSAKNIMITDFNNNMLTIVNNDNTELYLCENINIMPCSKCNIQISSSNNIKINGDKQCSIWFNTNGTNLIVDNPNAVIKKAESLSVLRLINGKYDPLVKYDVDEAIKLRNVNELLRDIITCNTNVSQMVRLIKKLKFQLSIINIPFTHLNSRIIDAVLYNNSNYQNLAEDTKRKQLDYSSFNNEPTINKIYHSRPIPLKDIWVNHISKSTIKLIDENTIIKHAITPTDSIDNIIKAIPENVNIKLIHNIADSIIKDSLKFNIIQSLLNRTQLTAAHRIFINRIKYHATELLKKGITIKNSIPLEFLDITELTPHATVQMLTTQWARMESEFLKKFITKENIYEILNHKFKLTPVNLFKAIVNRTDITIGLDIITQVNFINQCMKIFPNEDTLRSYAYELYTKRKEEIEPYISFQLYTLLKLTDFEIIKKFESNHNRVKLTNLEPYIKSFSHNITPTIEFINSTKDLTEIQKSKSLVKALKDLNIRPSLDIDNISYRIGQSTLQFSVEDWTRLPKQSSQYESIYDQLYSVVGQFSNKISLTSVAFENNHQYKTIIFTAIVAFCETYLNYELSNDAKLLSVYWFIIKMKELYPDYQIIAIESNYNNILVGKTRTIPAYSDTHDFIINKLFQLSDISYPPIENKFVDHVKIYTPNHIF